MATSTKNIIVGAADIFISSTTNAARPTTTASDLTTLFGTGQTARTGLLASTSYKEAGYTNTGFELAYEPVYGEVVVDQLKDAARIFQSSLKVMLKTELVESTLQNLQLSWGQQDSYYANTGSVIAAVTTLTDGTPVVSEVGQTLNIAAGALGDAPTERTLIAVGNAPSQVSSTVSSNLRNKERVYVARRVVSIDTTMHSLKRDTATVFPVNFRCLPDDSISSYAGKEYGVVIDRVWGAV